VFFKLRHGGGRGLSRQQEVDPFVAFVKKSEDLEAPRPIEESRELGGPDAETGDVRGQLAVEESLTVAALNGDQDPSIEPRLAAFEEQPIRR
jgi:hypothetical protein